MLDFGERQAGENRGHNLASADNDLTNKPKLIRMVSKQPAKATGYDVASSIHHISALYLITAPDEWKTFLGLLYCTLLVFIQIITLISYSGDRFFDTICLSDADCSTGCTCSALDDFLTWNYCDPLCSESDLPVRNSVDIITLVFVSMLMSLKVVAEMQESILTQKFMQRGRTEHRISIAAVSLKNRRIQRCNSESVKNRLLYAMLWINTLLRRYICSFFVIRTCVITWSSGRSTQFLSGSLSVFLVLELDNLIYAVMFTDSDRANFSCNGQLNLSKDEMIGIRYFKCLQMLSIFSCLMYYTLTADTVSSVFYASFLDQCTPMILMGLSEMISSCVSFYHFDEKEGVSFDGSDIKHLLLRLLNIVVIVFLTICTIYLSEAFVLRSMRWIVE